MSEFDDLLLSIRGTREQMRKSRKRLEALLKEDMADVLMGPTPEAIGSGGESATRSIRPERWREQFRENWPDGRKRKRWLPLGVRR